MELIVRVSGDTEAELLEGLEDVVALIQGGHTRLRAQDDPERRVQFELHDDTDGCPVGDPGCDAPNDGEWHCHDACEAPQP